MFEFLLVVLTILLIALVALIILGFVLAKTMSNKKGTNEILHAKSTKRIYFLTGCLTIIVGFMYLAKLIFKL